MGIVHSKVLGGANLYGSGRGILEVGKGAYRYVDLMPTETVVLLYSHGLGHNNPLLDHLLTPCTHRVNYNTVHVGGSLMLVGQALIVHGAMVMSKASTEKDSTIIQIYHPHPRTWEKNRLAMMNQLHPILACTEDEVTDIPWPILQLLHNP